MANEQQVVSPVLVNEFRHRPVNPLIYGLNTFSSGYGHRPIGEPLFLSLAKVIMNVFERPPIPLTKIEFDEVINDVDGQVRRLLRPGIQLFCEVIKGLTAT